MQGGNQLTKLKVLLIDDEPSVIDGLKAIIPWDEIGFQICGYAYNGEDAYKLIKECEPDLIITDIKMPIMDGLQLIGKCIEELNIKAHFIILSGYDDFSFARQALKYNVKDYILKPVDEDEMIPVLKKIHKQIESNKEAEKQREIELKYIISETVSRILNGEDKEKLYNRARMILGISDNSCYRLCMLEIEDIEEIMNNVDGEVIQSVKDKFINDIKNCFNYEDILYIYDDGLNKLIVFINESVKSKKNIAKFAEGIKQFAKDKYNVIVSIYISDKHLGITSVNEAYKQVLETRKFRFYKGKGCVLYSENYKNISLDYNITQSVAIESIIEHIELNNAHSVVVEINTIFAVFLQRYTAPEVVHAFLSNIYLGVVRLISSMEGNIEEFVQNHKLFDIDINTTTLECIRQSIINFCKSACKYLDNIRKKQSANVINDIITYINKNYHEDLSIKSIAERFYMNPTYLGQLFKKTTGLYFNDYLNVVRIEEAKKLLRRTNLKIYEIAQKVGYTNPDYFMNRFEKLNNISPLKYRKSISKYNTED